jgi:hypothetical protein
MVCWYSQVVRELKRTAYRPKMAVLVRQEGSSMHSTASAAAAAVAYESRQQDSST